MSNYEKLFKAGNAAQLEKLKENDHKSGFMNVDLWFAFNALSKERDELLIALLTNHTKYKLKNVRCEAADIANFAHMIILQCDKRLEDKKNIKR